MAWATKFRDVSFLKRADFLKKYIKLRSDDADIEEPYEEVFKFIVGGLYVCNKYRYISEGAVALLKKNNMPPYITPKKSTNVPCKGLRHEHTIPMNLTADYLLSLNYNNITVESLAKILEKIAGIALITEEEDGLINSAGLQTTLPNGITVDDIVNGKAKHSARYDTVGIKYEEFQDFIKKESIIVPVAKAKPIVPAPTANKKDNTKYSFKGEIYGKGRLVLAVVANYIKSNPSLTYEELKSTFPDECQYDSFRSQRYGVVHTIPEALKRCKDSEDLKKRFFTKEEEFIKLKSTGDVLTVSKERGIGNINQFLNAARRAGIEIQVITIG